MALPNSNLYNCFLRLRQIITANEARTLILQMEVGCLRCKDKLILVGRGMLIFRNRIDHLKKAADSG